MRSVFTRRMAVVVLALIVVGGGTIVATGDEPAASAAIDAPEPRLTGDSDLVVHGSAWMAQRSWKFRKIFRWGWGTQFKRGWGPTNEWVHVSIPWASRVDGDYLNLKYVEFCAQSTAGTVTKPTRVDIWENNTRIVQQSIAWPPDNNYHCVTVNVTPAVFAESVGVSVLVHFENKPDKVTFYKAWAIAEP